jgi:hypothetical protein
LPDDALTAKEDAKYELFAVANHKGIVNKGHYYAFTRPPLIIGEPTESGKSIFHITN